MRAGTYAPEQQVDSEHVVMDNVIVVSDDDKDEAKELVNGDSIDTVHNSENEEETDFMIADRDRSNESETILEEDRNSVSLDY